MMPSISGSSCYPSASKASCATGSGATPPKTAASAVAAEQQQEERHRRKERTKFVKLSYRAHVARFVLAWALNVALFLVWCVLCLVYAVTLTNEAFDILRIVWIAGLVFVWVVIEPSEVLGQLLFPSLANNECVQKWRQRLKDYGIYG